MGFDFIKTASVVKKVQTAFKKGIKKKKKRKHDRATTSTTAAAAAATAEAAAAAEETKTLNNLQLEAM